MENHSFCQNIILIMLFIMESKETFSPGQINSPGLQLYQPPHFESSRWRHPLIMKMKKDLLEGINMQVETIHEFVYLLQCVDGGRDH